MKLPAPTYKNTKPCHSPQLSNGIVGLRLLPFTCPSSHNPFGFLTPIIFTITIVLGILCLGFSLPEEPRAKQKGELTEESWRKIMRQGFYQP